MSDPRIIHGNHSFLMRLDPDAPSPGALAAWAGVGQGGLHPQLRVTVGQREVIVDALDLLARVAGDGRLRGEAARALLGRASVEDLEVLIEPLAENLDEIVLRLDAALPEAAVGVRLVGHGWYRLRREEGEALQARLARADEETEEGQMHLAHALLEFLRRHDLPRLEVSEQRPGAERPGLWRDLMARAAEGWGPRPSPVQRLVRGITALQADRPLEAERELGAASMGGEARAARWLALAHGLALRVQRPEPRYLSAPRASPSPELLAKLALERPTEVGGPAVSPWRVRVLLVVVLLGALLLWSLQRSFQSSILELQQTTRQLEEP